MTPQKTTEFAFGPDEKQAFKARLKHLIGGRSIRAAAASWGLSYSTLNNYLTKTTEPSFFVMGLVAHKENASLEWLAYGIGDPYKDQSGGIKESSTTFVDPLQAAWEMIFKSLSTDELTALISLLMREGAKGVLALSAKKDDMDRLLTELPAEEKERLIALHEAKKGSSEERDVNDTGSLSNERQAG